MFSRSIIQLTEIISDGVASVNTAVPAPKDVALRQQREPLRALRGNAGGCVQLVSGQLKTRGRLWLPLNPKQAMRSVRGMVDADGRCNYRRHFDPVRETARPRAASLALGE
jgi:hypothetical protein